MHKWPQRRVRLWAVFDRVEANISQADYHYTFDSVSARTLTHMKHNSCSRTSRPHGTEPLNLRENKTLRHRPPLPCYRYLVRR